jgi:hypothetical protein
MFNGRWFILIRKQHWPMNRTLWPPTFYFPATGNVYFLQSYYNHSMLFHQSVFVVCTTWLLYCLCHSDIVQTVKFCDLWHHIISLAQKVILTYFIPLWVALCMVLRKYSIVVLADLFFQKTFKYKRYEHTIHFLIYEGYLESKER